MKIEMKKTEEELQVPMMIVMMKIEKNLPTCGCLSSIVPLLFAIAIQIWNKNRCSHKVACIY